jgi:hypothetical protein
MIKNQMPKKFSYKDAANLVFEDDSDSVLIDLDPHLQNKTVRCSWKIKNCSSQNWQPKSSSFVEAKSFKLYTTMVEPQSTNV